MKFSEKLQKLRKEKGFSQEDLANELNVTRQTVSKWELDQTVPDMNKLIEISKLFDISLDELTGGIKMKDEYTNETYNDNQINNNERKNAKIALKVFIVGAILSLIIGGIGVFKQINAKNTDEKAKQEAIKLSEQKIELAKARLQEIQTEYNELKNKYNELENECNIIDTKMGIDNDWFTKSSKCKNEKSEVNYKMNKLELEYSEIQSADYTAYYPLVDSFTYKLFYYIAAGVFGVDILISVIFFLVTRKK